VYPPNYSYYIDSLNNDYEMGELPLFLLYLEDHADKPPHKNTPGATDCLPKNQ
jgi:hypothetical protein